MIFLEHYKDDRYTDCMAQQRVVERGRSGITGRDSVLSGGSLAPDWPVTPRRHVVEGVVRPPRQTLYAEGFAVSDYNDLDRAGDWLNCMCEACRNRAYLTLLYPDAASAVEAVPERAVALARALLSSRPKQLTLVNPLVFYVWRVEVAGFIGRDYRSGGCGVPESSNQLRHGSGHEIAWCEIRRQRDDEEIEGALLPGATPGGELFLFVEAAHRVRRRELVQTVEWR